MTNHNQKDIIQEQMRANKRIFRASESMSGQYAARRPSLNERMGRIVSRDTPPKPSFRPPKSK